MSRRLLVAAGGGAGTPGGGGPTDPPDPDPNALNTAWHGEHTATMQPDWDNVFRVGPNREYTTLSSALTAASATPYGGYRGGIRTGFARSVIVLDPGTYNAHAADSQYGVIFGRGVDIIGNGATRDDVQLITSSASYNLYPWENFYLANMTVRQNQGPTGHNYSFHGSDPLLYERRDFTSIIDNVNFICSNTGATGIAGWDMPRGTRAFIYRSRFESTVGSKAVIFHDMEYKDVEGLMLECAADVALPAGTKTWNIGCTTLDGTPIADTYQFEGVTTSIGPELPMSLPVDGMTTTEAAKYSGGLQATGTEVVPAYPSTANLSGFTAGRTYFIPVVLPKPMKVAAARMNVITPTGSVAAGSVQLYTGTSGLAGNGYIIADVAVTATAGNITRPVASTGIDTWLPAGALIWLCARVNDAACVVKGSATFAASTQCYYVDDATTPTTGGISAFPSGASIQPLPSGSAVPWVALVAA